MNNTLRNHIKSVLKSTRTLKMPPDSTKIGKLDYPFTSEELEKAKHVLKQGKACGNATLNNEIISVFFELYPDIALTLFNSILDKNITIDE